jgi:Domain of unknown function (DUF5666)
MMNKKLFVLLPIFGIFAAAVGFAGVASAQTISATGGATVGIGPGSNGGMMMHGRAGFGGGPGGGGMMHLPGVFGSVTAINGTTLSVQSIQFSTSTQATSSVTYSVDASNATVIKDNATSTVSAIDVGDTVAVRGTVSGDSVTATNIFDGKFMMGRGGPGGGPFNASSTWQNHMASSTPSISGTVSAVSGSILTVTGSDGTVYTVDTTNATLIKQGNPTNSISAINVGDSVQIQGTVSGTSVTATVVLDNVAASSTHPGFLGTITSFFSNIFHFHFRF